MSEQHSEIRNEVVLPSSLVLKVKAAIASSGSSETVSEFVEKAVRASLAKNESAGNQELTEADSEAIKERLKSLGYL